MSSRREFLTQLISGGGAVAVGLSGCVRWIDPAPVVQLPAPLNGILSVDLSRYPDLAPDWGAISFHAPGIPPVLVVHVGQDTYAALSGICTHAGCPVGVYNQLVECPCHGSRFGLDGQVVHPPATQGLRTYPATVDPTSGDLLISLQAGTPGFPPLQDGKVIFSFASFPSLKSPGSSVVGTPSGMSGPIVVVARSDGTYAALDATCTHLGCTVSYSPALGSLGCPCHGSVFALSGAVLSPPAQAPLRAYAATADANGVTVSV